jgi:hypothetical protein
MWLSRLAAEKQFLSNNDGDGAMELAWILLDSAGCFVIVTARKDTEMIPV